MKKASLVSDNQNSKQRIVPKFTRFKKRQRPFAVIDFE